MNITDKIKQDPLTKEMEGLIHLSLMEEWDKLVDDYLHIIENKLTDEGYNKIRHLRKEVSKTNLLYLNDFVDGKMWTVNEGKDILNANVNKLQSIIFDCRIDLDLEIQPDQVHNKIKDLNKAKFVLSKQKLKGKWDPLKEYVHNALDYFKETQELESPCFSIGISNNKQIKPLRLNDTEGSQQIESDFRAYLTDLGIKILPFLINKYQDAKPKKLALMLHCLQDYGLLSNSIRNFNQDSLTLAIKEAFKKVKLSRQTLFYGIGRYETPDTSEQTELKEEKIIIQEITKKNTLI